MNAYSISLAPSSSSLYPICLPFIAPPSFPSSPPVIRPLRCSNPDSNEASQQPAAGATSTGSSNNPAEPVVRLQQPAATKPRRTAESTDWVASSLTRRFGLGAGLAWVGVLAFGVVSEQIKTRTEVFLEKQGTREIESAHEVVLPNKVKYADLREGGGASPHRGDLVVVDLLGKVQNTGEVFIDTFSGKRRSIAFVFGARPYTGGICTGLEDALQSMKVGGKRKVIVPQELGFGGAGEDFGGGVRIPPGATLEYVVQLQRVSIPPS